MAIPNSDSLATTPLESVEEATSRESSRDWAFTGDRLRALRSREMPPSPLPGVLDPEPHLHNLVGKQKTGKTRLVGWIALNWSCRRSPWPGAPPLPGTRVLWISREQPVTRIDSLFRRLDESSE